MKKQELNIRKILDRARSKSKYIQAHILPENNVISGQSIIPAILVVPNNPQPPENELKRIKPNESEEQKKAGEQLVEIRKTIEPEKFFEKPPTPITDPKILEQQKLKQEEIQLPEEPLIFPIEKYLEFHTTLDQATIMSLLDMLRGKRADLTQKGKIKCIFHI